MSGVLEAVLSDEQGQLFELSAKMGFDSETFIKVFMNSRFARGLDAKFNHLQWAGRQYIMECICDELKDKLKLGGEIYDSDTLYWIGYIYRRWHYITGEDSRDIYKQASAKTMKVTFIAYHTLSDELAVDRLKETYADKHK